MANGSKKSSVWNRRVSTRLVGIGFAPRLGMADESPLRYLDADHVEAPLLGVGAVDVLDESGHRIGSVDGVLVDPAARKAHYLVIRRGRLRAQRALLPLANIRIDAPHHALRLDDQEFPLEKFDPRRYPAFSDDDLLTAIFADRAA